MKHKMKITLGKERKQKRNMNEMFIFDQLSGMH